MNCLLDYDEKQSELKHQLLELVETKIRKTQELLQQFKEQTGRTFKTPEYEYWYHKQYPNPRNDSRDEWYRLDFNSGEIRIGNYEVRLRINDTGHLERYDKDNNTEVVADLREERYFDDIRIWELDNANRLLDAFYYYHAEAAIKIGKEAKALIEKFAFTT